MAFDNLKTGMTIGNTHPELAMLTTSPVVSGRILGQSKSFSGPAGIVVSLNGNNVVTQGDMTSRFVETRHNPDQGQNLAKRTFRHSDLMSWTLENRGHIIGALACIMAHRVDTNPVGRFPAWSRAVADPIIAVSGVQGFYRAVDRSGRTGRCRCRVG